MEERYDIISEELTTFIGEIVMSCNTEGIEYDSWYCLVNQGDQLKTANLQNIFFRFEYSHNNDQGVDDLEERVRLVLLEQSEKIEKLKNG